MALWDFAIVYVGLAIVAFYVLLIAWRFTFGLLFGQLFGPFGAVTRWRIERLKRRYMAEGMGEWPAWERASDVVMCRKRYGRDQYE